MSMLGMVLVSIILVAGHIVPKCGGRRTQAPLHVQTWDLMPPDLGHWTLVHWTLHVVVSIIISASPESRNVP